MFIKKYNNMKIGALITAAGMSVRMGDFKPLLPFKGKTVIENTVETVLNTGSEHAVVVTGYRAEEIERVLEKTFGKRVIFARNRDYAATDMLHSIRTGLKALPECDMFFLLPGDMPAVKTETLKTLIRRAEADKDRIPEVIFPEFKGRRSHPPLISAKLLPEILSFEGEGGLRGLWRTHEDGLVTVPVEDEGVGIDLDTPKDYDKLMNTKLISYRRMG